MKKKYFGILSLLLILVAIMGCQSPVDEPVEKENPWAAIDDLPNWLGSWTKVEGDMSIFAACCTRGGGGHLSLTPEAQVQHDEVVDRIEAGLPGNNPLADCLPDGMPGILTHGITFEFLFSPGIVTQLFEDGEVRRIFTDGRDHQPEDLYISAEGHAIGHWEGEALVVDTVGMTLDAVLFLTGNMKVTKDTHVIEKYFLTSENILQIDTTVIDPNVFTEPYTYTLEYDRLLREDDFPIGCKVSNRDLEESVDLTPPPEY